MLECVPMDVSDAHRILIADDEPLIRQALADLLTDYGYVTETVGDGQAALSRALEGDFDLLMLDLRMPSLHGLDVITSLAAARPNLPIVVISGTGVLGDAVEAMRAGAWDYMSKPLIDMDEILVVIDRVLEKARLIAERDHYQQEIERLNRSLEAEVARQTDDLRAQNRRLAAINRVAYTISHAPDLDTMLARALSAVVGAAEVDAGYVQLLNPATDCLYLARTLGLTGDDLPFPHPLPLGEGVAGRAARAKKAVMGTIPPGAASDHDLAPQGFRTYAYIPLHVTDGTTYWDDEDADRSTVVGVLAVFAAAEREFDADEVELLTTIGNQLGVAITRTQVAGDLQHANLRLETVNADLRRLDTLREQFIQNVAHELRTPLALVAGYIDLLAEGVLDAAQQRRALAVTQERVEALVGLVESITTLQDLSAQPLQVAPVAPAELLKTACKMMGQKAISAGVILECRDATEVPPVSGDFQRLTQALCQLLDNACKFSAPGSRVVVEAGVSPDRNYVTVAVSDEGIGIPETEHVHIFERFYQVDGSATRRYGGTGLGLALVKEIVEAHGGWVQVESEVGTGSTFTLSLPCAERVEASVAG